MISGIGIDIVHARRMERWRQNPGLLTRFFHPDEINASLAKGAGANMSLAARFAAKEALGKALGTGLEGIVLKEISVINRQNGQPELFVYGKTLEFLNKIGAGRIHLSLSHEEEYAIAMVVLEGKP